MLTQVLEVLFNLSDVAIAGKYAYNTYVALGAVGSTTTLVSLFTGLLIGMGAGVNVSVARWLGIGDSENVERTTHSSLLICTGAGVLVCLICAFFAEPMLRLLNTKEEFLPGAVLYLRIYALGLPGIGIYNCGNGILSATGDTKRPLIYLSVAGVLNVILNPDDRRPLRPAERHLRAGQPVRAGGSELLRRDHRLRRGCRRQRRYSGVQHDGGVLHRLRQLRQPQLGRGP